MTTYELVTYDVLGNAEDGYDVNDVYSVGEFEVTGELTDSKIRRLLGVRCAIETDGDEDTIYVNRSRDGYPLGELRKVYDENIE